MPASSLAGGGIESTTTILTSRELDGVAAGEVDDMFLGKLQETEALVNHIRWRRPAKKFTYQEAIPLLDTFYNACFRDSNLCWTGATETSMSCGERGGGDEGKDYQLKAD